MPAVHFLTVVPCRKVQTFPAGHSGVFAVRNRPRSLVRVGVLALPLLYSAAAVARPDGQAVAASRPSTVLGTAPSLSKGQSPKKFYREWTMKELLPAVADLGSGRDWAKGRELFRQTGCGLCHAMGAESEGNGLAPDLTGVASTVTREFILQSILEPSATINGRFFHSKFTLKNGDVVTGSVIETLDKKILIAPVMMNAHVTVEIAEADVKVEEPSPVSPMPAGLVNELTREEIVELMAFLDAGGDRTAAVYRKK